MKPFNLERAKSGDPVMLMDKTKVHLLTDKWANGEYCLLWTIEHPETGLYWGQFFTTIEGKLDKYKDEINLFMIECEE